MDRGADASWTASRTASRDELDLPCRQGMSHAADLCGKSAGTKTVMGAVQYGERADLDIGATQLVVHHRRERQASSLGYHIRDGFAAP